MIWLLAIATVPFGTETWQIWRLPTGIAGAAGDPPGVPATTEATPVPASITTTSIRLLGDDGAAPIVTVCCATSVTLCWPAGVTASTKPASITTDIAGGDAGCGAN
ncbi:MAG: hypothetical protein ACREEN_01015 [Stellaceae bacterium]